MNMNFGGPFPYRGVSLDIDGTLYSLWWFKCHLVLRRTRDLEAWIVMEQVRKRIRRELRVSENMHEEIIEMMAEQLQRPTAVIAEQVKRMLEIDWPYLLTKVGPYRGVTQLLTALNSANIPVVLNSDYPGVLKAKGLGLDGFEFRAIVDATSFNALKPRPEAFQATLDHLNLPPEDVLHVGDSLELDVAGASSVGMASALVGKGGETKVEATPTWHFSSTNSLARALMMSLKSTSLLTP